MKEQAAKITGNSAAAFGCIATFVNADELTATRRAPGAPAQALRLLCDHFASIDPTYRLVCYSNPQTILTDLAGREMSLTSTDRRKRLPSVEKTVLTRAKRPHMAHASIG